MNVNISIRGCYIICYHCNDLPHELIFVCTMIAIGMSEKKFVLSMKGVIFVLKYTYMKLLYWLGNYNK